MPLALVSVRNKVTIGVAAISDITVTTAQIITAYLIMIFTSVCKEVVSSSL